MQSISPMLLVDGYKVGHVFQYPEDTTFVYSNLTARKPHNAPPGDGVVFFGLQFFLRRMHEAFDADFFALKRVDVVNEYKRVMDAYLGPGAIPTYHIEALHEHGKLPILVKALPEGSVVPYGVPMLTICNTDPRFFWVTNMLETWLSSVVWKACTS